MGSIVRHGFASLLFVSRICTGIPTSVLPRQWPWRPLGNLSDLLIRCRVRASLNAVATWGSSTTELYWFRLGLMGERCHFNFRSNDRHNTRRWRIHCCVCVSQEELFAMVRQMRRIRHGYLSVSTTIHAGKLRPSAFNSLQLRRT